MPRRKFTARSVGALPVPARGQVDYWDDSLPGFGLRISFGGTKTWILMYYSPLDGRKSRLKIGRYPIFSLSQARERAQAFLRQIADGQDPAEEKKAARKAETFGELADQYLEQHAKVSKRSWKKDERAIERDLRPEFGRKKANSVTRREVVALLDKIKKRGAPIQANRVHEIVRRIYSWGASRDLLPSGFTNPAVGIERAPESQRERVLDDREIRTFWSALEDEPAWSKAAFRLRLLTIQRGGEIRQMRRQDLSHEPTGVWWTIPGEIAKNSLAHRVPLSPQALDTLLQFYKSEDIAEIINDDALPDWVFANPITGRPYFGFWKPTARIRKRSKIDFQPHDLRRTGASRIAGTGTPRLVVGKILNHVDPNVTAVYDRHGYDQEKRAALDAWGKRLEMIIKSKGDSKKVVPLHA